MNAIKEALRKSLVEPLSGLTKWQRVKVWNATAAICVTLSAADSDMAVLAALVAYTVASIAAAWKGFQILNAD